MGKKAAVNKANQRKSINSSAFLFQLSAIQNKTCYALKHMTTYGIRSVARIATGGKEYMAVMQVQIVPTGGNILQIMHTEIGFHVRMIVSCAIEDPL